MFSTFGNTAADIVSQQIVQRLLDSSVRYSSNDDISVYLAQQVVNVPMMLSHTLNELVEILYETSYLQYDTGDQTGHVGYETSNLHLGKSDRKLATMVDSAGEHSYKSCMVGHSSKS